MRDRARLQEERGLVERSDRRTFVIVSLPPAFLSLIL
jgi:hypothetical protein